MSNVNTGELARVVNDRNNGALCTVIEIASEAPLVWACRSLQSMALIRTKTGQSERMPPGTLFRAFDANLRPMRGGEGADETLSWKSVPDPVHEVIDEAARVWAPKPRVEHAR
jgi:hypothetical protein